MPSASARAAASAAPVDTTPPPAQPKPIAELEMQTVAAVFEALNAHDAAKVVALFADDAAMRRPGLPDVQGRTAILEAFTQIMSMTKDAKYGVSRAWQKGDVVALEYVVAGTFSGDLMGKKVDGKPVGQMALTLLWFTPEGLIKELHGYADGATGMAQIMGAKSAKPPPPMPATMQAYAAKNTSDEDKIVAWAKAFDLAFETGKEANVLGMMMEDAELTLDFAPAPSKGKMECARDLHAFFVAFPEEKWTIENAWGVGDFAIVEHTLRTKQKGTFGPVASTNKDLVWHFAHVYQVKDGKMSRGVAYANMLEAVAQLAPPVVTPPPSAGKPVSSGVGATKPAGGGGGGGGRGTGGGTGGGGGGKPKK